MTPLESFFKNFLEPFSYLIYAIIFFLNFSKDKASEKKVLFIYYLCATILLLIASINAMYVEQIGNNWLYNIFYLITICVLSYYFYKILNTRRKKVAVILLLMCNLVTFIVSDIIVNNFFKEFNDKIYAICFICIVIYALLYFDQLLRNVTEQNILYQFDFWLVSGYLIYFLGSFIIILFYRSVDINDSGNVWALQNIILFLSSVITLTGYLRIPFRKKLF